MCTSHLMPVSCTDPPSATSYTCVCVHGSVVVVGAFIPIALKIL